MVEKKILQGGRAQGIISWNGNCNDYFQLPAKYGVYTPPKTNMSPENQWLEDVFPIKIVPF